MSVLLLENIYDKLKVLIN